MTRPEPVPPCIHNTPAKKLALRDALYGVVYERTIENFHERMTEIREKNRLNMGYSWDGFTHRGVYYGAPIPTKIPPPEKNLTGVEMAQYKAQYHSWYVEWRNQQLDPQLVPDLDQLLAERQEIENGEGAMVRTILGTILNSAQAISDYKRLLPSVLHNRLDDEDVMCSCEVPKLTAAEIDAIKAKHDRYIGLIQKRQLIYLLTP